MPDTSGNGLAMRAGMFIEALSQQYAITLLTIPIFPRRNGTPAFLGGHCADIIELTPTIGRLKPQRKGRPPLMRIFEQQAAAAAKALGDARFDVIQAQRLYLAPLALRLVRLHARGSQPQLHLDLDDLESATHESLARLNRHNLRPREAQREQAESASYAEAEARLLPRFDRVYVCSEADAARVRALCRSVQVIPNTVRPPQAVASGLTTHPFRFLFVGSLDYYPNEDAVRFFCTEVVPLLRGYSPRPFQVRVVGTGLSRALMPLTRIPGVRLVGASDDLALEYREADAVVVPLRAGGGTRIKVLEAFAYQRPVISTATGVEGIDAEAERDYLQGETAEELARQCLRLMEESGVGPRLVRSAGKLLLEHYSQASVNRLIASLPLPSPRPVSR